MSAPAVVEVPLLLGQLAVKRSVRALAEAGDQGRFYLQCFTSIPLAMRRYRVETYRTLADITWGSGAIVVGGGTVGVMVLMSMFMGAAVGVQGYSGLDVLGLAPLVGFVSAYGNTRELAPLIAAIAFAAQVGCRYTAQIGAMRISEEIDALEVMAIRSVPYLVSTRVVAAMTAILPLYLVGLVASYLATRLVVTEIFHQSGGTYDHYFFAFLSAKDIVLSVVKVVTFVGLVTLVHCSFGYNAKGGPEGVGVATGRAIRASIILIIVLDMLMTLAFWGFDPGVRISG